MIVDIKTVKSPLALDNLEKHYHTRDVEEQESGDSVLADHQLAGLYLLPKPAVEHLKGIKYVLHFFPQTTRGPSQNIMPIPPPP